jgi:hypothetical protein
MSTQTNQPNQPANPAKGPLRGQTTLAAKVDRWQNMSDNVAPQLDAFPQLKDFHTQLQQTIADARALGSQLKALDAESLTAVARRQQLIATGNDLFSRLGHGLKSALGPKSEGLVRYGVKRTRSGRKAKTVQTTPTAAPTTPPPAGGTQAQGIAADPGQPGK